MKGTTHMPVGFAYGCAGALTSSVITLNNPDWQIAGFAIIAGSVFGSLLPDVDHPNSLLGKVLPFISYPMSWLSTLFGKGKNRLCRFLSGAFGHRGLTHTLPACLLPLLILIPVCSIEQQIIRTLLTGAVIGITLGILSHLCADTLNPTGIAWLWPFSCRKVSIGKIVTGSSAERIVIVLSLVAAGMAGIVYIALITG